MSLFYLVDKVIGKNKMKTFSNIKAKKKYAIDNSKTKNSK